MKGLPNVLAATLIFPPGLPGPKAWTQPKGMNGWGSFEFDQDYSNHPIQILQR